MMYDLPDVCALMVAQGNIPTARLNIVLFKVSAKAPPLDELGSRIEQSYLI